MAKRKVSLHAAERFRFSCTACWRSTFVELLDDYTGFVTQVQTAAAQLPEACPHCQQAERFELKSWSAYVKKIKL